MKRLLREPLLHFLLLGILLFALDVFLRERAGKGGVRLTPYRRAQG